MPQAVGVSTGSTDLNRIRSITASATIPVNPQTKSIVEIELQISDVSDWRELEGVHPRGTSGARPEIEGELPGAEVPVRAIRDRDSIVRAIETKCIANFARPKGSTV